MGYTTLLSDYTIFASQKKQAFFLWNLLIWYKKQRNPPLLTFFSPPMTIIFLKNKKKEIPMTIFLIFIFKWCYQFKDWRCALSGTELYRVEISFCLGSILFHFLFYYLYNILLFLLVFFTIYLYLETD